MDPDSGTDNPDIQNDQNDTQQRDQFVPPKDGSWIPRQRFDEAIGKERARIDALEASLQREREERIRLEERAKAAETKPDRLSRAQLDELVEQGALTAGARDQMILQDQMEELKQHVGATVAAETAAQERRRVVREELDRYKRLIPEVLEPGSDARRKVEQEFDYLARLDGQPRTDHERLTLELKACRAAFGPSEKIPSRKRQETHRETEGGGDTGEVAQSSDGSPTGLSAREKAYYGDMIHKGIYKDWKEVGALVGRKKP